MNPTQEQMPSYTGWAPAPGSVVRHNWPCWSGGPGGSLTALSGCPRRRGGSPRCRGRPRRPGRGPGRPGRGAGGVVAGAPGHVPPRRGPVLLGLWRSFWAYGVRWRTAMMLSGLGGRFNGDEYVPRAVRVRAGRFADRVTVRMVVGQQSEDWSRRLGALAHGFGARVVQVVELPADPATLQLTVGRLDPLAHTITVPAPAAVDLGAIHLGRREDGQPWTVRLRGSHTLIAGATGAGKSVVLWCFILGLGPAVRDGLVKLWVLDPKSGMELAAGRPLFDRFAYDRAADMADVLEDAVAVMQARAAASWAYRLHQPSTDEP